ncbi:hypothetical protein DPEC_G00200600 [Dallia pectoralis]|uniref:Uncharacterized protein n=1 Tax=Dallia pectoralis TaxID=75939 RepID=A0ACC2G8U4_DALPE|nr:hypothetical protein DPEC_G00200600 [Dallia pectoralis]
MDWYLTGDVVIKATPADRLTSLPQSSARRVRDEDPPLFSRKRFTGGSEERAGETENEKRHWQESYRGQTGPRSSGVAPNRTGIHGKASARIAEYRCDC